METLLRLVLAALLLVGFPIAFYYRGRANRPGGQMSRAGEPPVLKVVLRLCGLLTLLGVVLWLVNPDRMRWAEVPLPAWLRWAGVALAAAALPLMTWMFRSLGLNVTDTLAVRPAAQLVTSGPYRYVRHPMYLFGSLLYAGYILTTANWAIAVTAVLGLAALVRRTRVEEENLLAHFGEAYRRYMERTPRFIPRP